MITSIDFQNFKVLQKTTLPLSRFTLVVGANGSGKSTALKALQKIARPEEYQFQDLVTASLEVNDWEPVAITVQWGAPFEGAETNVFWAPDGTISQEPASSDEEQQAIKAELKKIAIYSLDARALASPVRLQPNIQLGHDGAGLAGVLDRLRDHEPERFEALNEEVQRWFPEFDRILFDTPSEGKRVFLLRIREGQYRIPAADLSQGTLIALAILTLAYLPDPPSLLCLEEPDRGIHPRLLREVQDALYRLSYPESCGEKREPVQVIATTHSPYFLDLYRDHPEEVVIAHKTKEGGRFERLSEQPNIMEILGDAPLGEVWYSGILGGVPAEQ